VGGDEEDDEERQEVEEPGGAQRGHGGRGGVARHGDAAGEGEGERAGVVAEEGVGRRVARAHPRGPEPCCFLLGSGRVGCLRAFLAFCNAAVLLDRSLLCERAHGGIRSFPRARWLGSVPCLYLRVHLNRGPHAMRGG